MLRFETGATVDKGAVKPVPSSKGTRSVARTFENPFLVRELRQLARRPRGVQVALFLCMGVMVAVLLAWLVIATGTGGMVWGRPRPAWDETMLWLLVLAHTVLCSIAAIYGGYRLFAAEHLRSTFELTQLLPYSPVRWLVLKLAFPALGVGVAWLAGFPFYYLAALCQLPIDNLLFVMHKPLLAGLSIMLIALLLTPEYLRRYQQQQAKIKGAVRGTRIDRDAELGVWTMLATLIGYSLVAGLVFGAGLSPMARPFYQSWAPEAFYWVVCLGLLAPSAFLTGVTALVSHERAEVLAHRVRTLALVLCYYLLGGLLWKYLSVWYQLGFLLLPVAVGLVMQRGRSKNALAQNRDNAQGEQEVQWIMARFPNAMFLRDLRVYTRAISIRRYFAWMLGIVLVLPLAWWGFVIFGRTVLTVGIISRVIPQIAIQMGIQLVMVAWSRPTMLWHKERVAKTLPLLLLTPLTSQEILLGRLLAAPIYQWGGQSPLALLLVGGIVWAMMHGIWVVGPLALALPPLVISSGIWTCCNPAGTSTRAISKPWGIVLIMLHTLLSAGSVALLGAGVFTATAIKGLWTLPPLIGWCCGLLLGICNAALCWAVFRFKVKQLDTFREGDMEVPDSKELAPLRARRVPLLRLRRGSTS